MKRKPKKKKQSNADQLSNEIEELLFDIATITDKLIDLLPRFKRLKAKHRRAIYEHIDLATQQLCATVDDYEDETPPAPGQEKAESRPAGSVDLFGPIVGAFGIAAAIGEAARRASQDPEWPKEINCAVENYCEPEKPAEPDPEAKHD